MNEVRISEKYGLMKHERHLITLEDGIIMATQLDPVGCLVGKRDLYELLDEESKVENKVLIGTFELLKGKDE